MRQQNWAAKWSSLNIANENSTCGWVVENLNSHSISGSSCSKMQRPKHDLQVKSCTCFSKLKLKYDLKQEIWMTVLSTKNIGSNNCILSWNFYVKNSSDEWHLFCLTHQTHLLNLLVGRSFVFTISYFLQAVDQSDFDWSDPEKLMEKAGQVVLNALKANPDIR